MNHDFIKEGYFAIERELEKRRQQADSVRGKETPFRVEFRYPESYRRYQYFCTYEDALMAEDASCGYTPFGNPRIRYPLSQVIQIKGPRGGWKKYKKEQNN